MGIHVKQGSSSSFLFPLKKIRESLWWRCQSSFSVLFPIFSSKIPGIRVVPGDSRVQPSLAAAAQGCGINPSSKIPNPAGILLLFPLSHISVTTGDPYPAGAAGSGIRSRDPGAGCLQVDAALWEGLECSWEGLECSREGLEWSPRWMGWNRGILECLAIPAPSRSRRIHGQGRSPIPGCSIQALAPPRHGIPDLGAPFPPSGIPPCPSLTRVLPPGSPAASSREIPGIFEPGFWERCRAQAASSVLFLHDELGIPSARPSPLPVFHAAGKNLWNVELVQFCCPQRIPGSSHSLLSREKRLPAALFWEPLDAGR